MLFEAAGVQHLGGMDGRGVIEHGMVDGDQELVIPAAKASLQRVVAGLRHDAHAHPIPELFLGDPVFLAIVADDQCRFFDSHSFRASGEGGELWHAA